MVDQEAIKLLVDRLTEPVGLPTSHANASLNKGLQLIAKANWVIPDERSNGGDRFEEINLRFVGVGRTEQQLAFPKHCPGLDERGEHSAYRILGPALHCWRRNHPLQKAMEYVVRFDSQVRQDDLIKVMRAIRQQRGGVAETDVDREVYAGGRPT